MDHESMRALIGTVLLWAMGIAAVLYLIRHNWEQIREICLDENGKFDPIGGLEKKFSQSSEPQEPSQELTPDERFMSLLAKQKGAQMAGFDPERDHVREHIIFHGRVQGVGFRYQAMYAARTYGLTGWVENLPDGSVEMEVQGTPAGIGRVLTHLGSGHWIRIDDMKVEEIPLVPDERGFGVRGY
jgi:acylphosphatase